MKGKSCLICLEACRTKVECCSQFVHDKCLNEWKNWTNRCPVCWKYNPSIKIKKNKYKKINLLVYKGVKTRSMKKEYDRMFSYYI